MSLTGDFGGLDAAIRRVTACAEIPRRAVGAVASELSAVIRESFRGARTPEGIAWRRLKDARGRPLVKSGRLRATAIRPVFFGLSVRVQLTTYGGFQNDGTATIPARAFLPAVPLAPEIEARFVRAVREKATPR
jgi:phage gpG-like protein